MSLSVVNACPPRAALSEDLPVDALKPCSRLERELWVSCPFPRQAGWQLSRLPPLRILEPKAPLWAVVAVALGRLRLLELQTHVDVEASRLRAGALADFTLDSEDEATCTYVSDQEDEYYLLHDH